MLEIVFQYLVSVLFIDSIWCIHLKDNLCVSTSLYKLNYSCLFNRSIISTLKYKLPTAFQLSAFQVAEFIFHFYMFCFSKISLFCLFFKTFVCCYLFTIRSYTLSISNIYISSWLFFGCWLFLFSCFILLFSFWCHKMFCVPYNKSFTWFI